MSYEPNTWNAKVYTPGGLQLYVCMSLDNMNASDIDAWIAERGFLNALPGAEPGEVVETITHVVRYTQHNSDNTTTPCIGLYFENPKLEFAKKAYLDTPEQQATFEAVSGLTIASLPEFPTSGLPKRSDRSASQFVKAVPTPFKVRMAESTYTDDNGEIKPTTKFAGFLTSVTPQASDSSTPVNVIQMPTGNTKFTAELAAQFNEYWKSQNVDGKQVMAWLGVEKLSEWQKTVDDANAIISEKVGA